ncbi:Pr6Pr family membrane protein [Flavobacterium sp. LHD-80]|uniref:Pr6Pr family membrane protein n=1 Tax=Flavobacterium sp. LHD-80 TaxID=3071411 RepID=UPI0027E0205A|nr:Pr6Pr family membrane protein [Flavobacterium sp. LHD-80]MDQ6469764.1 Pr6Pr family membrane protein [Flavobacterium sp. LHD-80]
MEKENTTKGRILPSIIFVSELYALPVQFYLLLDGSEFTFLSATVRFFSFFTILTNSIVFFWSAMFLFGGKSNLKSFFSKYATITAITVYIMIVGIVFNVLLRSIAHLTGQHRIVSEIFHAVVPTLVFFYWLFVLPSEKLSFKVILPWLIYPIIYIIYTLLHGISTNFYPYPFVDVTKIGFEKAIINGLFVLLAFVILSIILIFISNKRSKNVS